MHWRWIGMWTVVRLFVRSPPVVDDCDDFWKLKLGYGWKERHDLCSWQKWLRVFNLRKTEQMRTKTNNQQLSEGEETADPK